jgi:hypothetical protein
MITRLIINAAYKGTPKENHWLPSHDEWIKVLLKADAKALVSQVSPIVALVAAHAGFVYAALRLFGATIEYRMVIYVECYFIGFFLLLYAVLLCGYIFYLPSYIYKWKKKGFSWRYHSSRHGWIWRVLIFVIPPCMVIFKAIHSYFVLLSAYTGFSKLLSLGLWLLGTIGFGIAALVLYVRFMPIIAPEYYELYRNKAEAIWRAKAEARLRKAEAKSRAKAEAKSKEGDP